MYRGRLWTMRQYAGMGDAEESNKRYKYLLANGTTGLSVAFDLPTQIGMDSDYALAVENGEGGRGDRFDRGYGTLFAGIELTKISISMTINATDRFWWLCMWRWGGGRAGIFGSSPHGAERCTEGIHCAGNVYIFRHGRPCA